MSYLLKCLYILKGGEMMADFEVIDVSGCMNSWSALGIDEEE